MSVDFKAIGAAVATRFSAANITAPSGQTSIRFATASLPGQIKATPTVLVFPPGPGDIEFTYNSSLRSGIALYPVRFYLMRILNEERNSDLVLDWMSTLYDQLDGQLHLGLSSVVSWALIRNIGAATLGYGGEEFEGIVMDAEVHIAECMTPVA